MPAKLLISPIARVAQYYDRLVDRYGHDPRACDASSVDSLSQRYRVLSEVMDIKGKSVLEVGCGFGDLGVYLMKKYRGVSYAGIHVSRRMVEEGQKVHPGLRLTHQDLWALPSRPRWDVVMAQGIFYLLGASAPRLVPRILAKMFALARCAVAVTAISAWSPRRSRGEYYLPPEKLLTWGRRLTSHLTIRHDYHPGDVTAYLYNDQRSSS